MQSFYQMGIVLDNEGKFEEAAKKYKNFLSLAVSTGNTQAEALAYNCLGINAFKLGQYELAIRYHNKHLELTDSAGRLLAHTNLGIAFQAMGFHEHAAVHHQHAVDQANRLRLKDAQCFTVGNLGMASKAQGDLQTSKICLQYHLRSAQSQKRNLGDTAFAERTLQTVNNDIHRLLGQVESSQGRLEDASGHFAKAMDAAHSTGNQVGEETSAAMQGIVSGLMGFDQYVASQMEAAMSPSPSAPAV
jgi:tetratricopeptide (TPR) repeat protein